MDANVADLDGAILCARADLVELSRMVSRSQLGGDALAARLRHIKELSRLASTMTRAERTAAKWIERYAPTESVAPSSTTSMAMRFDVDSESCT